MRIDSSLEHSVPPEINATWHSQDHIRQPILFTRIEFGFFIVRWGDMAALEKGLYGET